MSTAAVTINPMTSTNIQTAFSLQTDGFVVGTFLPDPAVRFQMEGGVVAATQSTPLWGGLPLKLTVPANQLSNKFSSGLGPAIVIADSLVDINAWAVFDQAANGLIAPGSNAPQYGAGMTMNFFRGGSNARIVLPVLASDVASIISGAPTQSLYWDPVNLRCTLTSTSNYGPLVVQIETANQNSKTISYNSGTGQLTWVETGSVVVVRI